MKNKTTSGKTLLSQEAVTNIAFLLRIILTAQENKELQKQLSETLSSIEKLNEVAQEKHAPTNHVTGLENIFREDISSPEQRLTKEEALSNTTQTHNSFFKVPAILEENL